MLHFLNISNIVAFDAFAAEMGGVVACRFINLPAQLGHWRLAYLGSCSGHLRLSLGVWDLGDYDKAEWCLKHEFSFKNLKAFCNSRLNKKGRMHAIFSLRVLGFHPYDKDILYLRLPDCIAEYNMRTDTWEAGCEFPLGASVKNNTEGYLVVFIGFFFLGGLLLSLYSNRRSILRGASSKSHIVIRKKSNTPKIPSSGGEFIVLISKKQMIVWRDYDRAVHYNK
ncbi:hypothetical protein Cgig2_015285 [Carnegiea gigantea]|uniref:Uncharacterized protein n=1 Tax=Carnegiea gigantea TaxID=171969 RepID=A0A9Q1QDK4_9CARY|nr:hypothetical protein Cgig2_015285 [Carnegiea gigantea]